MLLGKNCRGTQECDLTPFRGGPERRPQSNLRFAEPHVSAYKPIHRFGLFHISQDVLYGFRLIRRFLEAEGRFKFTVQLPERRIPEPLGHLTPRIHFNQVFGDFFDSLAGFFLAGLPGSAAQTIQRRLRFSPALKALDEGKAIHRNIKPIISGIVQQQEIVGSAARFHAQQPPKAGNAVIPMDQQVAGLQLVIPIKPLEGSCRNAAAFLRMWLEEIFPEYEALIPNQFSAGPKWRHQSEQAMLFPGIPQQRGQAILRGQIQKFRTALFGSKAQNRLPLVVLPPFQCLNERLPRAILLRSRRKQILERRKAPFRQIMDYFGDAHHQRFCVNTGEPLASAFHIACFAHGQTLRLRTALHILCFEGFRPKTFR